MNIQEYLKRIGIDSLGNLDLEALAHLQQQHLLHIPFENLDIHLNKKIILDYEAIFEKVVYHRRGGFCHELNGLFYLLLKELGYSVKRISGRVRGSSGTIGAEADHMTIIVALDNEDWLVDVGFGKFSFSPLKIILDEEQTDGRGGYKISSYDEIYHGVFTKAENEDWQLGYLFTLDHRPISYFKEMCDHQQTSPTVNFTKRRMITIPTQDGRVTLTDTKLKLVEDGKTSELTINSEAAFREKLKEYFDMSFDY